MALFVPNPDAESVEEIIEQLSLELAQTYREAEVELIRENRILAKLAGTARRRFGNCRSPRSRSSNASTRELDAVAVCDLIPGLSASPTANPEP